MDEARHGRAPTGRTAQDHDGADADADGTASSAPIWTHRTARGRSPHESLLVHWIDERGSVVRLITSGDSDTDPTGAP